MESRQLKHYNVKHVAIQKQITGPLELGFQLERNGRLITWDRDVAVFGDLDISVSLSGLFYDVETMWIANSIDYIGKL